MKSQIKWPEWLKVVLWGSLLHVGLFVLLGELPDTTRKKLRSPPQPVSIVLKSSSAHPEAIEQVARKPTKNQRPAAQSQNKSLVAPAPEPAPGRYASLLPTARDRAVQPALPISRASSDTRGAPHRFAKDVKGKERQVLLRGGGTLVALFDVPMVARKRSIATRAFVKLRYDEAQNKLLIEQLRGEPLLRAVLYETLRLAANRPLIKELFDASQQKQLKITLQTDEESREQTHEDEDFSWQEDVLSIFKSAPVPSQLAGGAIALPDEEAARAIRRDLAHLSTLQKSPAYFSPLHQISL